MSSNIPSRDQLTPDEERYVAPAREAMGSLQKTFDTWIVVIRGWKVLRDRANRQGGRDTFKRLMDQHGFRMNPKPIEDKVVDKSVVTKGLQILERLAEVGPWHERLPPKYRREWASPSAIFKHCPAFQTDQSTDEVGTGKKKGTTNEPPTTIQKHDKLRGDYLRSLKVLTAAERATEATEVASALGLDIDLLGEKDILSEDFTTLVGVVKMILGEATLEQATQWKEYLSDEIPIAIDMMEDMEIWPEPTPEPTPPPKPKSKKAEASKGGRDR